MGLEDVAAAVLLVGLTAYAVFGGADFGGGVWTALARGRRAEAQRESIFRAMGPVWETHHVWLVLVLVVLFTAFPPAFAYLFTALMVPLVTAVIGITFRGAAFGYRHFGAEAGWRFPGMTKVFSGASILTPLAMGMALGAVSGGAVEIRDGAVVSGFWGPWLGPFAWVCGLAAVAVCGFLMACYMTTRTSGELWEDFRRRGLLAGVVLAVLLVAALPAAWWDAAPFWEGVMKANSLALLGCAAAALAGTLVVLWRGWLRLAPFAAAAAVAFVLAGWGVVQYPYLILPGERISDLAAMTTTLRYFLIALPIGAVILVPSLVFLYVTFSGGTEPERSG